MGELDDDTLIALVKKGDTHAEALLCAKYWTFAKNFGKKFASLYYDLGFTDDEFASVAFASIVVAMKKYIPGKEANSFYSYWLIIAKNQCINYVHDNSFIDLDSGRPVSFDSVSREDGLTLHEICGFPDHKIDYSITRKQLYDFIVSKSSKLSDDERIVAYYMFFLEYDYEEIQLLTKWPMSKVYRVAWNARRKVSNFIKSRYFN